MIVSLYTKSVKAKTTSAGHPQANLLAAVYWSGRGHVIEDRASKMLDTLEVVIRRKVREARCTSDDPNNHQGDTCPIHES